MHINFDFVNQIFFSQLYITTRLFYYPICILKFFDIKKIIYKLFFQWFSKNFWSTNFYIFARNIDVFFIENHLNNWKLISHIILSTFIFYNITSYYTLSTWFIKISVTIRKITTKLSLAMANKYHIVVGSYPVACMPWLNCYLTYTEFAVEGDTLVTVGLYCFPKTPWKLDFDRSRRNKACRP